jgi:hypothetical protein
LQRRRFAIVAFGRIKSRIDAAKQRAGKVDGARGFLILGGKLDDRLRSEGRLLTRYKVPSADRALAALCGEGIPVDGCRPWHHGECEDQLAIENGESGGMGLAPPAGRHSPGEEARRKETYVNYARSGSDV